MFDRGQFNLITYDTYSDGGEVFVVSKTYDYSISKVTNLSEEITITLSKVIDTVKDYYTQINKIHLIHSLYGIILQPTNLNKNKIKEQIKTIQRNRITDTELETSMDSALEYINRRTQRGYTYDNIPGELVGVMARIIENQYQIKPGVANEKLGDYSITYADNTDKIDEVLKKYKKYRVFVLGVN